MILTPTIHRVSSLVLAALAVLSGNAFAANRGARIAGSSLSRYTVVYQASAESEEGSEAAAALCSLIESATGVSLAAVSDEAAPGSRTISIVNGQRGELIPTPLEPFAYSITAERGRVVIDAGGAWAMRKASQLLAAELAEGSIPSGFCRKGTVEGEFLFPRPDGVNLRILDNNVWEYSKDNVPDAWEKIGVDPRDKVRAPQFAQLVRAYMPDIICLQEYCDHMDAEFYPLIARYGYANACAQGENFNHTPVIYNPEALELLKSNYSLFTDYCNHGSKSFTSAVFRHKATGCIFAVVSTHLWHKQDSAQPGSSQGRASQVRLIMAECEEIRAAYSCPVLVMGDMNCEETTIAIRQFLDEGYVPCYRIAEECRDMSNGCHMCFPGSGYSRVSSRPVEGREAGAIDHCFLWNDGGKVKVRVFDCIRSEFTVKLTDHYPNLFDMTLE